MSTDITVKKTNYQVGRRDWLWGTHGTDPGSTPSIMLDISAFTAATHFPNGYLLSGIVLGRITATGLYGPYNDTLATGQEVAAGLLFSEVNIPNLADLTKDAGGALYVHGFVRRTKLPIANAAAGRGFLDAAGETDLRLIHFSN